MNLTGNLSSDGVISKPTFDPINVTLASQIPLVKFTTWTTVTLIVCFLGSINNLLVIYAVWPRMGEKSGVNLLLVHYLIANLLHCLVHFPIRCIMVQVKQSTGYTVPLNLCKLIQTFLSTNGLVLTWADAGLGLNRCVALFFPHSYKAYSTSAKNLLQIFFMWFVNLALIIPFDFEVGGYMTIVPNGHCGQRYDLTRFGRFSLYFKYASYTVNGVTSALILWKCYRTARMAVLPNHGRTAARMTHRVLMAKMLVLVYLWSLFSTIPADIIINAFPRVFRVDPIANLWLQIISIVQWATTPSILLVSNAKYRDRLYCLMKPARQNPASKHSSHTCPTSMAMAVAAPAAPINNEDDP